MRSVVVVLLCLLLSAWRSPGVPVSLSGSAESMSRQHSVAREAGYRFLRTLREVRAAVADGLLVRLEGGRNLELTHPDRAFARPEVRHFVERFAAEFRQGCGERLVVTSLTRPTTRQPSNAHPLSVHPAGMAMDLRVPRTARCRRWLERSLLRLESAGVLDATRENRPPHYHVALFPAAYLGHLMATRTPDPEVVASASRHASGANGAAVDLRD